MPVTVALPTTFCSSCDCAMLTGAIHPGTSEPVCLSCFQRLTGRAPLPGEIERFGGGLVHDGKSFTPLAPGVCRTPSPGGPIPIPYPIQSSGNQGTKRVTVKVSGSPVLLKDATFRTTTGDEAGTLKGVVSSRPTTSYSPSSVKVAADGSIVYVGTPPLHNRRP